MPLRHLQRGQAGLLVILAAAIVGIALFVAAIPNQAYLASRLQGINSQRLAEIRLSLLRFAVTYGRLPCPARITVQTTSALYGIEAGSPGNCVTTGVSKVSNTDIGAVPWVTLGLAEEKARDAYGHRIEYMVLESATGSSIDTIPALTGELNLFSGTPVSAGAAPIGNQLNACSTTPSDNSCNQLGIFALLSRGANAFGAYTDAGTQLPSLSGAQQIQYPAEWENLNGDLTFVSQTGLQQTTFDDMIVMQSTKDYIVGVYNEHSLPTLTKFTNDRVQKAFAAIIGKTISQNNTGFGTTQCNAAPSWPTFYTCAIGITPDSNGDGTITAADAFAGTRQWRSGSIPYLNIGIPLAQTYDEWGHALIYGVNSDMVAGSTALPPRTSRGISSAGTAGRPRVMTTFGIVPYIAAAQSDMAFEVRSMGADGAVDNGPPGSCIITTSPINNCDDIYLQIRIPTLVSNILNAGQSLP